MKTPHTVGHVVVRRGQRIVAGGADGGAEDGGRLRLPRAHLRPGLRVGLHVDGVVRAQVVVGGEARGWIPQQTSSASMR